MLWYKNWRETIPMLLFLQIFFIQFLTPNAWRIFAPDYNPAFFGVFILVGFMFLGGSGIRTRLGFARMKSSSIQSTLYTLSLPVSRRRLLIARALLGLLEMLLVSIILAILVLCTIGPRNYLTISTMSRMLIVCFSFGMAFYFFSTLMATVLHGAYHLLTCYFLFNALLLGSERLGWLSTYVGFRTLLRSVVISGIYPWLQMGISVAAGMIFLFLSVKIVESQEY
jgi:hypothetical protein